MKRKILIYLSSLNLTLSKFNKIIEILDENEYSFGFLNKSNEIKKLFKEDAYVNFIENCNEEFVNNYIKNLDSQNVKTLTVLDDEYPEKLLGLEDRPIVMYYKGDISLLNKQGIAIVGTRSPSSYGKIITEKFAEKLTENGFVIISGMAYGVDGISHRKCLEVGGKTIAVLGGGFNNIYPAEHTDLAKEIAEKGLLLSEFPPNFEVSRYSFPQRNRIIAGLAEAVLITEAGFKSGTIYTKDYALEYGKDIFAVPGNITSSKSELTNHIIKTAQGECVLSPEDIIEFYHLNCKILPKKVVQFTFDEQIILKLLENGEKDLDFLVENSKISLGKLNGLLLTMEVKGFIARMPGGLFIRKV